MPTRILEAKLVAVTVAWVGLVSVLTMFGG